MSTLGIAVVCMVVLGLPLVILARHEVWTAAHDHVQEQAVSAALSLEDRLDAHRPVNLTRLSQLLPRRRIVVAGPGGVSAAAGAVTSHPIEGHARVLNYTVTVQAPRGPVAGRARDVSLVVLGLAVLAAAAAAGLAFWQARRLATPVAALLARADSLGRGVFESAPLDSGVPEIDELAAALARSAQQISALIELQRDFASDAAHQLRTPLTSIGLHLDEMVALGSPTVREEAEQALRQVERLDAVISSLLARARGDAGGATDLDLSALVTDGCAGWDRLLAARDRTLVVDAPAAVQVHARRDHVLAVLGSLLDNALVHGAGAVSVVVRHDRGAAVLAVRDDGDGVPPALGASLFERRVSGGRGTGIGLALASALAAADGGSLRLDGDDRSRFVATWPACATSTSS